MDPVYKSMHSFPYHVDQTHFLPYHLPGFEAAPTQMYVNPVRPQFNNECWPWGGMCSAYPAAYHGCCGHNNVPNHYSWRPPYSWSSPYSHVPPLHSIGSSHSFPIQYMPTPHYPMELPQYECEKRVQSDHHCCGCPNHSCHQKEERNVKIEEEAENGERIKIDSQDPCQLSKCPYPILWLPPNDRPRREHVKTNPLDCRNLQEDSNDVKSYNNPNTFEQQPAVWNGWNPYNLNNFESFKKKGDDPYQQDEYKGQFPFSVFWMPYKPEEKGRLEYKENSANPEPRSELVKHSDGETNDNGNGEHADDQASLKEKSIPSKEENEILRNNEKESELVKVAIDSADKKFSRDDFKKNSSSPKSSKLPPVCLRVEPLTRRKNTSGSSRSLSPPGEKQKSDKISDWQSEAVSLTGNRKTDKIANSELMKGEGITKTIEVVDGKSLQGESVKVEVGTPVNLSFNCQGNIDGECTETDIAVVKGQSDDAGSVKGENAEIGTKEVIADEADKPTKTKLSIEEAAIIIQSAYRGFSVRRWEPVKKLKQIAEVREQIAVVNNLIQAMELSSDIKSNSKQRNIIAETIMSLLLRLDTIQGLHQSIREVRKSAVRELVNLQEKLDSLINENSEASPGLYSSLGTDENSQDVLATHNGNETYPDLENLATEIPENCVIEVTGLTSESTTKNEDEQSHEAHEDVKVSFPTSNFPLNPDSGESDASNASMSDKSLDKPVEIKLPSQQAQECHLEQDFGLIDNLPDFDEASDVIGTEEGKSERDGVDPDKSSDQLENAISNISNHIDVTDAHERHLEQETSIIDDLANIDEASDMIGSEVAGGKPEHDGIDPDKSSDQLENAISNISNHIDVTDAHERHLEQETSIIDDLANIDEASDMIGTEVAEGKPKHDGIDSDKSSDQQENAIGNINNHIDVIDAHECCLEPEISLIDDLATIDEASDMIGAEVAVGKFEHDGIDLDKSSDQQENAMVNIDNHQTDIIDEREREPHVVDIEYPLHEVCEKENGEMLSELTQDRNQKHLLVKENIEVQGLESLNGNKEDAASNVLNHTEIKHAVDTEAICQVIQPLRKVSLASDELTESNTKLIEENGRLRDMLEKLIKSGQEQLNAISILSGRVKALEKRLSRKKKLKTKRCRTSTSESFAHDSLSAPEF